MKPEQTPQLCPQCNQPIEAPHVQQITRRAWDHRQQKQKVETVPLAFCSQQCGSHYQMSVQG